jgi:hypothetical protein
LPTSARRLHRDYGMAVWSGLTASLAILLLCGFWIATSWPDGGTAVMMASTSPASLPGWTILARDQQGGDLVELMPPSSPASTCSASCRRFTISPR